MSFPWGVPEQGVPEKGEPEQFPRSWGAEVLRQPPLIRPARQYVWPLRVPGEEEAIARGALEVMVRPKTGGSFLATCALGFADPAMPSGVFGCPDPDTLCAVAGGYAYVADSLAPEQVTLVGLKPVVAIHEAVAAGLLLFCGFQTLVAWGVDGFAWETGRLSWEGVRVLSVGATEVVGMGWDLMADVEREFRVDLRTGKHVGGGFTR